jgi:hypothetical protein
MEIKKEGRVVNDSNLPGGSLYDGSDIYPENIRKQLQELIWFQNKHRDLKNLSFNNIEDIDWIFLLRCDLGLTEEFLDYFADKFDGICWKIICETFNLSELFMQKHWANLNHFNVSSCQKMSHNFIEKHKEEINFEALIINNKYYSDDEKVKYMPLFEIQMNKIKMQKANNVIKEFDDVRIKCYELFDNLMEAFFLYKDKINKELQALIDEYNSKIRNSRQNPRLTYVIENDSIMVLPDNLLAVAIMAMKGLGYVGKQ